MSDANDDVQAFALAVVSGVVALVIAGVVALAAGSTATRAKSAVAAAPAQAEEPLRIERVYFDSGADALSADAQAVLASLADAAREQDGTVVLISGFHDASGDPARNAGLAKQRAEAVRHALEANGIALERLVLDKPALVLGGSDPREARRVELRLRR